MLDIGFQEIVVIGVIALLVIGPERLPKVARTVGLYVNKLRRFVTDVRSDVERELHTEEVRRAINEMAPVQDLYDVVEDTKKSLTEPGGILDDVKESVLDARQSIEDAAAETKAALSSNAPAGEVDAQASDEAADRTDDQARALNDNSGDAAPASAEVPAAAESPSPAQPADAPAPVAKAEGSADVDDTPDAPGDEEAVKTADERARV